MFKPATLLPSAKDTQQLKKNLSILVARVLCSHLPFFEQFDRAFVPHIQHQHTKEMAQASEVVRSTQYAARFQIPSSTIILKVPLGILLKSETTYTDMVQILDYMHKYVPTHTSSLTYTLPTSLPTGGLDIKAVNYQSILITNFTIYTHTDTSAPLVRVSDPVQPVQVS